MIGWLDIQAVTRPGKPEPVQLLGLPVLRAALPPEAGRRQLRRALKSLARRGVRRVLLPEGWPAADLLRTAGLTAVSPLALCRALAPRLADALLEPIPPRQRVVLLRARGYSAALLPPLAEALCPRTALLLADTDRGFDALAEHLQQRYGAALLLPGQGPPPRLAVELSPGPETAGAVLKLWGEPHLAGLELRAENITPPPGVDSLPLLALLWETGRLKIGQILVVRPGVPLDIMGKKSYNS